MSNIKKTYICKNCGASYLRWSGKCETCGEWNTLEEVAGPKVKRELSSGAVARGLTLQNISVNKNSRKNIGINEFDRVLGGGLVTGSIILLGGEPGIGKSTIALQICSQFSDQQNPTLYISGEESANQVKSRLDRIKAGNGNINFVAEIIVENIIATIEEIKPNLVLVDSIQTIYSGDLEALPGSITQVKDSAMKLIEAGKRLNIPIIIIGHVTKEGNVAGPKTLEHLVDTVLYLEGERYHNLRILRSIKNRFGATNEVGVFEMGSEGLIELADPSKIFLQERLKGTPGSVITSTLEGNRSFMLEVQGLTTKTVFGYPKRTSSGFDANRLQLLIAILTKRANINLGDRDVYLNIVGGFKISEPAADLAVCLAIASSYLNKPLDPELSAWGEVGLAGELRNISQLEKRVKEASKMGFSKILIPRQSDDLSDSNTEIIKVKNLSEAISKVLK